MINLSDMNNDTDYHRKLVIQIITDRVDGLISILIIFTNYVYIYNGTDHPRIGINYIYDLISLLYFL